MLIPAVVLGINSQVDYVTENEKRRWGSHLNAGLSGMMWFIHTHGPSAHCPSGLSPLPILVLPSHFCGVPKKFFTANIPQRARAHCCTGEKTDWGWPQGCLNLNWIRNSSWVGKVAQDPLASPSAAAWEGHHRACHLISSEKTGPSLPQKLDASLPFTEKRPIKRRRRSWFISLFLLPIVCGSSSCSDKENSYERTLLAAGISSSCPLTVWRHQSFTSTIKCVSKMWQSLPSFEILFPG